MRKMLAISLVLVVALLGVRAAFAMGSMAMTPPATSANADAGMAGMDDHCAGKASDCCDYDVCALFCAAATPSSPAARCKLAGRMEPVTHSPLDDQRFTAQSKSPPAPPPRPFSLI